MKLILTLLMGIILSLPANAQKNIRFQSTIKVEANDSKEKIIEKAVHVVPTLNQYRALQDEFIAFIHFGPNTFTRMEWGNGMEDPKVFDLKELDTDQWCQAMKAAGMNRVILTVKHHDGFVLWQSRYTTHGVMSTNFRGGKGDVFKELSESCLKYGIKLGLYLSPADLYQIENAAGLYGNLSQYTKRTIPREVPGRPFKNKTKFEFEVDDYNEYFLNQLFELLTEYGTIHEVWFDGAHPKRKGGQRYNYHAWRELIRKLAPNAVIFGKEDIRWCGNEGGATRDTEFNVVAFDEDPNKMNDYADMTDTDLGSRDLLYGKQKPYYLHYLPAETNTSIREGWFYREDTYQKVRNADDVFDIYERSVGGNSVFLLNIPPNREGRFSPIDVNVLEETGKLIRETYGTNLLENANGPKKVLDSDPKTYINLDKEPREIIISTASPITINRIAIQEPILSNGERVEKHAVDAYIDGNWKEIAQATNIGYKRILRFPEITTNKIRVRILESRLTPAISNISAYYYKSRPPMLSAKRNPEGIVSIAPVRADFNWNEHGQNSAGNLNKGFKIYYTTDGKEPDATSKEYTAPFKMDKGEVKAVAILNGEKGATLNESMGLIKQGWKLLSVSSESSRQPGARAFDENPNTYWVSEEGDAPHFIEIDLGKAENIKGFAYTPQRRNALGMMEKGVVKISTDGKTWKELEGFEFGNLINDPVKRYHYFKNQAKTRYIRIEATVIAAGGNVVSIAELDFL